MKFSTISSFLSVAGIAAVTAADAVSSQTCVPYDGICFQNGVDYGACCGDGICAGSRCRNPKTETGAAHHTKTTSTSTAQPTCVPYDGICYLNGVDHGACCGDGICAGSRCRNPKTETGKPAPTTTGGGAVITQISDGQIQAPTGAPTVPVVAGAGKAIPGLAAAGAAVAFLL
ncbi:uncharacterized protein BBA_02631 [Beauveria bassiana ARSEF 2860]|uniref:GPI anchored serine-threonine rich protein n=1 Tax=Beauveria bassiana (strain ARSEF 2860) TaxID=655819 RepID=J4KQ58_BEAB2|nr:uncharacterized protein BBA_02631 [Beauveria bassiana ARSEF 2860]EJP68629.1 hypothetical protein BBA_02631 [Beauveria bassiana ARSEF 2860]